MSHFYYLETISHIEQGKRFLLRQGATSIGRSPNNTITVSPKECGVSTHHAIMYRTGDRIIIQDMQSTNGTFVNGSKVGEGPLTAGDTVGFGQKGPRFWLIASEEELPTDPATRTGSRPTAGADIRTAEVPDDPAPAPTGGQPPARPRTVQIESKLLANNADADDLHALMRNRKRLDRILNRGKLGATQSSLLVSAFHAGQLVKKRWYLVLGTVTAVSLVAILVLGLRMYHYRRILNRGLSLEDQIDAYEKAIFQANPDPEENRDLLVRLIAKLETAGRELSDVKGNLRSRDYLRFYMDTTEKFIDDIMLRLGETDYHIPEKMVDRVEHHLSVFSGRSRRAVARYLRKKNTYFPMIRRVFRAQKLPSELAYVSMLESGLEPLALSTAGARGLWQFMPATARKYGLRVDREIDDRCNPEKSTHAAAEYFKDLLSIFGGKSSVMLVMAAYNAGEGRIIGALRRIDDPLRNRDFWYIYRMGYLAEETNEYIPRVLALMIIDEHPELYGFDATETYGPARE